MQKAVDFFEIVEKRLSILLPEIETPYAELFKAARYCLLSKGKRIRPCLVLSIASAYGADIQEALDPACALELIHTYSLIHDDLPCMDNDDLRRGKPTLHKIIGEGKALLTGDYLLTFAFELLAKCGLKNEIKLSLIKTLAVKAGSEGMIGGQMMDLSSAEQKISPEKLLLMHSLKTAALFQAAFEFGSLIAEAQDHQLLIECGHALGLAYQFIDDIDDSIKEKNGKKITAASHFGIETAQKMGAKYLFDAEKNLDSISVEIPYVKKLFESLSNHLNALC